VSRGRATGVRRGAAGLLAGVFLAIAAGDKGARAQEDRLPPVAVVDGIPAGPFYLRPFLGISTTEESNPLYEPDAADPSADLVSRANLAFEAMLPFKKSYARVGYNGVFRRFAQTDVPNPDSRNVQGELSLLFSTYDRLVAHIDRTVGAAEVLAFDGGEKTYDGTPYRYAIYTVGAERDVAGHFGYRAAWTWSSLNFDQSTVDFFEFKGYDATADAHAPVSPTVWIVAGLGARRYDHMEASTGDIFRKEEADDIRLGVRGVLAGDRSYHAIVAWDRARYPGGLGSDFNGVVGDASFDLPIGPSTNVSIYAIRRRWSSFYGDNNYYVANTIGAAVRHRWPGSSDVGGSLGFGRSVYPDAFSVTAGGLHRRDREWNADAYATFAFTSWVGLRLDGSVRYRTSNDDINTYNTQAIGVELVLGWR